MHDCTDKYTRIHTVHLQERLTQLVKLMGGKVEGNFTKRVCELKNECIHVGNALYSSSVIDIP